MNKNTTQTQTYLNHYAMGASDRAAYCRTDADILHYIAVSKGNLTGVALEGYSDGLLAIVSRY